MTSNGTALFLISTVKDPLLSSLKIYYHPHGLKNILLKRSFEPRIKEDIWQKKWAFYKISRIKRFLQLPLNIKNQKIWKKLIKTDIKDLFEIEKDSKSNKKEDIALFIGRFQPLHHGHIYVIRNILKSFNTLKIGIGSSQLSNVKNDPFTNDERKQFINAALKKRELSSKKYKIYNIPDIFNAKKWCDHVISIVGEFDVVFSNSSFIRQLFQNKGIKVGRRLVIFKNKFNATNIRNLIAKDDKSWLKLVPKEVYNLIQKFNGVERIKSLNKKN